MRQLFFKIFLSVLLTLLLTFAIGMAIAIWAMPSPPFPFGGPGPREPHAPPPASNMARRPGPHEPGPNAFDAHRPPPPSSERDNQADEWRERFRDLITMHVSSLRQTLREQGVDAALAEMNAFTNMWFINTFLLDKQGREVQTNEIPSDLQEWGSQATNTGESRFDELDNTITYAERLPAKDGQQYTFIAQTHALEGPGHPPFARIMVLRLAPVAIGLGLVCYLLARYIAGPIVRLRTALRRFAEGDLTQRVSTSMGARRDEIGELARDFDHMAERIASLLGAQRRLLQDISHELRSPLARQRVALELIRQQRGEAADRAIDRAELEAERLDELIGELLTLTKLESQSEAAERTRIDLAELVREVIENAEFEACNDKRSVQLTACMACEAMVVPELMRRAVENIVRNALAYTAEGTSIEVSLLRNDAGAIIRVRDHGPGVPQQELDDIFRPFYRVSHARDRESGGVGLGLAIVARAIRSNSGTVVATNHPDGGLVIEIRLPPEVCGVA